MNEQYLAHLERTLRAFVRLVHKLDEIAANRQFQSLFTLGSVQGMTYQGPTWEAELAEAKACIAQGAEIARLKATVEDLSDHGCAAERMEFIKAQALEIERLKAELARRRA